MKRIMLVFAAGLAAASMILLLSVTLRSGSGHAATPTPLPTVPHYKCYQISGTAPVVSPVDLETQFGLDEDVSVGPPTRLCLAATKNGEGSLTEPDVECYQITGQPARRSVNLKTQFGSIGSVSVGSPNELCVPVTKAVAPAPAPSPVPTVPHYECYDIPGNAPAVPAVLLETLFGSEPGMLVGAPTRLCLPALKNGEGSLDVPHVECFGITGPPAAPIPPLNLRTQFGTTTNVPVEDPKELCVPAIKHVLVGGEQDLPDVAGNTDSGGSSLPYVAIAGAAAGLVVLGAGGWYARRRWLS
jgi:hypothetical protein